jgi:Co/Zn/Cd efflux system component
VEDLALKTNTILTYSIGIGGVVAFLLIVFGGFQIILSAGNPEKIKAGKEMITSAIAGLLLIIFSVFILRLIGYDILGIPGFGK